MPKEANVKKSTEDLEQYRCDGCGMVIAVLASPKFDEPFVKIPEDGEFCANCTSQRYDKLIDEQRIKLDGVRDGLNAFLAEMEKTEKTLSNQITAEQRAGNAQFAERHELQLKQVRLLHQNFIMNSPWLKRL